MVRFAFTGVRSRENLNPHRLRLRHSFKGYYPHYFEPDRRYSNPGWIYHTLITESFIIKI